MDVVLPEIGFELPSVGQVSFVVEDLTTGMARVDRTFGIDAFDVYRLDPGFLDSATYHGDAVEHGIAIALGSVGETSWELVEPLHGPSIHRDHLEANGPGFHHVAAFDGGWLPDRVVERLAAAGYPPVQTGAFAGTRYWYFDCRDVLDGLYFEIVTRDREKPDPHATYPADYE